MQVPLEALAYFGNVGPNAAVFGESPYTLGFFEAHALAVVLAAVLARGARAPTAGHHVLAAAVHAVLGAANLLFWPAFAAFGMVPAGVVATGLHAALASLHALAVRAGRFAAAPVERRTPIGGLPDYGFRAAAGATLVGGMYLHLTHILVGREVFLAHVFTPALDLALTVPMTRATVVGPFAWRRTAFRRLPERAGYAVLVGYFVLSSAVHARALAASSVDYVAAFPTWYSYPILVVLLGFFLFVRGLRFPAGDRAVPAGARVTPPVPTRPRAEPG